jgi:alpha-L-rhamnosidase
MQINRTSTAAFFLWAALPLLANSAWAATVGELRCEFRQDPLGLDVEKPRLSWVLNSERRGERQTAYQVLAASSPQPLAEGRGDLWDSGKVVSDNQVAVEYAGQRLASHQSCYWRVRAWDAQGKPSPWSSTATFTMGLLDPADWQAQWISDPVLADPANRPLTPIHCYRSLLTTDPAAPKWVTVDLGALRKLDAVDLLAARPSSLHKDFPSVMFPRRFKIEVANAADFHDAQAVVNQTNSDYPNPRDQRCHFSFPAVSGRFVRLTTTQLACWDAQDFGLALGGFQVFNGTNVLSLNAKVNCSDSLETEQWSKRFLVDGKAAVELAPDSPALRVEMPGVPTARTVSRVPLLRREFAVPGRIARALLSVSARGFYEVHINGQRVGDELLAPGYTSYHQHQPYQTHDVTALVKSGSNAMGVLLGYGWYAGHMNLHQMRCIDGTFPQCLAQLDIDLADGQHFTVVTDGQWRSSLAGPVLYSDLLDGEGYDYRRELAGWDQPGFDDGAWARVWTQPRDATPLVWQRCQPVRAIRQMRPLTVKEVKPGLYVFDLGQEITGWCRLKVDGPAGTHLTLRHAEVCEPDGNLNVKNLWGTAQQEDYLLDGKGERTLEPHFTYHGFRYVEVAGLPQPPKPDTLVAVNIHSDLPDVSEFTCSNELYNRIMDRARWTQRNLLFDVPNGCAARSERLAWLGDIRPCVQTVCFNFDATAFFTKYMQDIRDAQSPDGPYRDITPHGPLRGSDAATGSPGWADCGVSLPWETYVNSGDRRILEAHYASAARWVDYVAAQNPDFIWSNARGRDWGDWLSAGPASPKELGATAFFAHSADLLARMAVALDRKADAQKYAELFANIKRAFVHKYVSADGVIADSPGSADGRLAQGNYALALGFGLLDEPLKSRAVTHLCAAIQAAKGHPTIGFWSTAGLLLALSSNGQHSQAAKMLALETPPSWGYMANQATTFWEAFNSDTRNQSLNHWTHSSVGEWLWRDTAGLNPVEAHPGYASFVIHPRPCNEVSWCKAQYASVRGPIKIAWRDEATQFTLDLTVPATASAIVYLPTTDPKAVRESGQPVGQAAGIQWLRQEDQETAFRAESGSYHLEVTK